MLRTVAIVLLSCVSLLISVTAIYTLMGVEDVRKRGNLIVRIHVENRTLRYVYDNQGKPMYPSTRIAPTAWFVFEYGYGLDAVGMRTVRLPGIEVEWYSRSEGIRWLALDANLPSLAAFALLYPAALVVRSVRRRWAEEDRYDAGLCLKCGYDLQGSESEVCPECGTEVEA